MISWPAPFTVTTITTPRFTKKNVRPLSPASYIVAPLSKVMVLRLRKSVSQSLPRKIVASEEETDASFDAVSKEVSIELKLLRAQNSTVVGGNPAGNSHPGI